MTDRYGYSLEKRTQTDYIRDFINIDAFCRSEGLSTDYFIISMNGPDIGKR